MLLLAVTAVLAGLASSKFRVEADLGETLRGDSQAFGAYQSFRAHFGSPEKDAVLLLQAERFDDPGIYHALRVYLSDLEDLYGVRRILSPFSVPDPANIQRSFLGDHSERMAQFAKMFPTARTLLSEDLDTMLIVVMLEEEIDRSRFEKELSNLGIGVDTLFTMNLVGFGGVEREIRVSLIDDQLFLAPISFAILLALARLVLGTFRAAFVCVLPAGFGLTWTLIFMGLTGMAFHPLLGVAPTILVVLGIADSVHLYFAMAKERRHYGPVHAAASGLQKMMPAVVLTSLTSVIAFLSLLVVGSPALSDLAWIGAIGLMMTLSAVLVVTPILFLLLIVEVSGDGASLYDVGLDHLRVWLSKLLAHNKLISVLSLALLAIMGYVQLGATTGFDLMEHLPRESVYRDHLATIDEKLGGSGSLHVVIERNAQSDTLNPDDMRLLRKATDILYGEAPDVTPSGSIAINQLQELHFVSTDGTQISLPVATSLRSSDAEIIQQADNLQRELENAGLADAEIVGFQLMLSSEIPGIVEDLRLSFLTAVGAILVLAIPLARSFRLVLVMLVPNLLPILAAEAWMIATSQPMTITGGVALAVAFGIAVDNSIHLINQYRLAQQGGVEDVRMSVEKALGAILPAVLTTSILLLAGLGLSIASALPSLSLFGLLVCLAVGTALLCDLLLFPGLIVTAMSLFARKSSRG